MSAWRDLFDGESLNGWQATGNPDGWTVEDGMIKCLAQKGRYLVTEEQFEDFELTIEYKTLPDVNSGLFFRLSDLNDPVHTGLEIQILALPRVVNLSKREADMAITVSPPTAGRLLVQKVSDYHLHLAAPRDMAARIETLDDLRAAAVIGYIPDMIFDKELDYLSETGLSSVQLASNSVSVQLMLMRAGGGIGIAHDFAMPFAPELRLILRETVALTRTFYLVRHDSDRHSDRLNRFAGALVAGMRKEILRLEALVAAP